MFGPNVSRDENSIPEPYILELYNNAPAGIFITSPGGSIIYANSAVARLFGYEVPEELIASITDIAAQMYADPADRKEFIRLMEELGEVLNHECRFLRRDGTVFWGSMNVRAIREDGRIVAYQGFITDITDQKISAGKLEELEWMLTGKPPSNLEIQTGTRDQGYGDLTKLNSDGVILKSIGRERLETFAKDYLELLGTSSAIYEANGDYAFGIFSSGWCRMLDSASRRLCDTADNAEALASGRWLCHESCWTDCSKQAIADGEPADIECNGGIRIHAIPILAQGEIVGAINFGYGDPPTDPEKLRKLAEAYHLEYDELAREADAYDSRPPFIIDLAKKRLHVTARLIGSMIEAHLAEEALRKSEETLRTTLQSIGDAVISTDLDGLVSSMNPVAELLTGWSEKEALGQPLEAVFQIVNEQTREPVESPVTHVLESDRIVGLANHTLLLARGGREIPVADSGAPIRDDAGETIGVVLVFRDQSEERAAWEALEESEATIRKKLNVITEPGGDIGELSLGDIIDSVELQAMMEDFYNITRIGGAILDISGKVLVGVGWQDICTTFHRAHPEAAKNCLESDLALATGVPAGTFKAYRCKNNMWDLVSPITIGGKHLGNIYFGQFFFDDESVDYELFRKQARQYGFDETEYLEALDRVPRFNRETVEAAMLFYTKLAGMISSLSYTKIKLSRDIALRKRAEETLRESEERLRSIYRVAPTGIGVVVNRMLKEVNPRICEMTGYTREELVGKNARIFYPSQEDYEYVGEEKYDQISKKGTGEVETRWQRKDGTIINVLLASTPIDSKDHSMGVTFTALDITERKNAEQQLAEQKDLLSAIYRNAPLVLMVVNAERRIQQVNGFATQFAGRDAEEMLGLRGGEALRCMHVLDDPQGCGFGDFCQQCVIRNTVLDTLQTGKTHLRIEAPYYFQGQDDETREIHFLLSTTPIEVKGESMVLVTMQDITERKQAQEAVEKSEEKYRRIADNVTDVVWITDLEMNPVYISPSVERVFGVEPEEYLKLPIGKTYPPASLEKFRKRLAEEFIKERNGDADIDRIFQLEVERFYADGTTGWDAISARFIRDDQNNPIAIQGVSRDITDRKQAEAEQEKLQAQLNQARKMESVGRLAGGVAHDFNNMLGVILGHAEMVLDQLEPGQPLYNDLQEIRTAAERSADLTRQLLTFARKQTIAPRIIDLNETVEGMLKMLRRLIGEDIDLAWLPGKTPSPVRMDPSQIDQILANLCVNARDAIDDVGRITIETDIVSLDKAYCDAHAGFLPGEYVLLAVSDTGCGMDPETISHLFEPFYTTKERGKGTGLGLASVYGAVKQNGGFINVYSEPGQGSVFRIYLPQHSARKPVQDDPATAERSASGNETILLVEDEAAILRLATKMLEKLGYVVIPARTPGEAISLTYEHSGPIDLLMTDVVMPEMNGRDLAKKLLSIHPGIKRLFMSGYTANVIAHHGVLDEGVFFIQKPFSSKDLGAKLREVLEERGA